MFGNDEFVTVYDAYDSEKVFRTEGPRPHRRSLATFDYYRRNIRPDIYSEYGGILNEYGSKFC
jgi:hypothetical protein